MADLSLQTESVCANPTIRSLYAAYRRAQAEWDLAAYSDEYFDRDLPGEVQSKFCGSHTDALNRMLLHPASSPRDLALKLRVFHSEDLASGWFKASEIAAVLADDARRIANSWNERSVCCLAKAA